MNRFNSISMPSAGTNKY